MKVEIGTYIVVESGVKKGEKRQIESNIVIRNVQYNENCSLEEKMKHRISFSETIETYEKTVGGIKKVARKFHTNHIQRLTEKLLKIFKNNEEIETLINVLKVSISSTIIIQTKNNLSSSMKINIWG